MAKGKSSASSATRKKHARKAAVAHGEPAQEPQVPKEKKPKGKEKGKKNKEPRKKVYIPPVKPAPVQPDPLDTLGIAQRIPAELLVVLRLLAKKDSVTKRRALEDLQADWVEKARRTDDEVTLSALTEALPVWLHHLPALFLHPSRRIRLLAAGLHSSLLKLSNQIVEQLVFNLHEVTDADHAEYVIGAWSMAAHDVDRQVAAYARESWDRFVVIRRQGSTQDDAPKAQIQLLVGGDTFNRLWDFAQRVLLDPAGVYTYVNPPQPISMPSPALGRQSGKSTPLRRRDDDPPSRSGREEEEESDSDRKARLRIGGFGVARWVLNAFVRSTEDSKKLEEFILPMDNLALWSSLYHGQDAPWMQEVVEAFGYGQPGVRKAAWAFLQELLQTCKGSIDALVSTLSVAILRSAWVDPDVGVRSISWQPLLTFLKDHPNAWDLEASSDNAEDEEHDSEEDEEVEGSQPATPKLKPSPSKPLVSNAYAEFRQFLELGCMNSPVHGYPAVLVILSTIPPSILGSVPNPVQTLFTSFWAAIDGRALSGLDRTVASGAFLNSLLECLLFVVGRLLGSQGTALIDKDATSSPRELAVQVLRDEVQRVWEELCSLRLKVEEGVAAAALTKFFSDLQQRNDAELFESTWAKFVDLVRVQLHSGTTAIPALLSALLKTFTTSFAEGSRTQEVAKDLTSEVVHVTIGQFEQILESDESLAVDRTRLDSLVGVLNAFGGELFADAELASAIDKTCLHHAHRLLSISPAILLVYLSNRNDEQLCSSLWSSVLKGLSGHPEDIQKSLPVLLDAAEQGALSPSLRPSEGELDDAIGQLLVEALNDRQGGSLELFKRVLQVPDRFITQTCYHALISSLCATFVQHVQGVLRGEQVTPIALDGLLALLGIAMQKQAPTEEDKLALMPEVFVFAHLLPMVETLARPGAGQAAVGKELWKTGLTSLNGEGAKDVLVRVKQTLRDVVVDCSIPVSTPRIIALLTDSSLDIPISIMDDLLPDQTQLDAMLGALPTFPSESCLSVVDPLVLQGSSDDADADDASTPECDYAGYTVYARIVTALLAYFRHDRQASKAHSWALRHCVALSIWAKDALNVRSSESPVFGPKASVEALEDVVAKTRALCTYVTAHTSEEGWLQRVADGLIAGKVSAQADGVEKLLHTLVRPEEDCVRESRILFLVLEHVLPGASKGDADVFVRLARTLQKKAPHASLAILLAVTKFAPEPPILERYRNELAAEIFGVRAAKANTDGLWLLRRLAATAPDPESDIVYLPTPRAVNLMKACQQWIASDEELDEEVEYEMTAVFRHLAPILQNVPGAHWELVFDLMESNLENSSFEEKSSFPILFKTLELLLAVLDLVATNKALRSSWDERKTSILTLVRDLTAKKLDTVTGNVPLSVCRELALTVVQDLPDSLLDKDTVSKMCHILTDPSDTVQRMAYKMLRESAAKYTEHLVLEAGVDTEAEVKLDLPLELVELLQMALPESDLELSQPQNVFGYLLAWMLTFDLFTNASLKVKSGYLDHMRRENLIVDYFLPRIFTILRLYDGIPKAVRLDIWAVDEYFLDLYSADSPIGLPLLAAYLYYRSLHLVPALIRGWLLDCRDRQLSTTITTYTSTHFSPALLQAELMQVKDSATSAELTDENMKVKVASAVNEITALYTVDEQDLEIRLKLPSDWPLHSIEIKDSKRVGVTEDRWRAWILGVQQILTFRSGSIVDGLAFFKKNVSSHFEGQSECAICYSMISAMDGSLPKKPCRTCKNKFHAGCLYKWFNTSHSSSCPLCRSEIIQ